MLFDVPKKTLPMSVLSRYRAAAAAPTMLLKLDMQRMAYVVMCMQLCN